MTISIDTLPRIELLEAGPTAICDPEPSQADLNAGETRLTCPDALTLGLRALRTATDRPIERLYFQRPSCSTIPCTDDELSTGRVTGWFGTNALSVELDARLLTVTRPVEASDPLWPAGSSRAPAVNRETIARAPAEIADRTPYPFCGRAELGKPPAVMDCFRDAVLAGRPAEMLEQVYGTEGGTILWLDRYPGHGPVIRYQADNGHWVRMVGTMGLGVTPSTWDFEPWFGGEAPL